MPVSAPTNVAITKSVKALILSWTNSVSAGTTHTVWRSRGVCGAYVAIATNQSATFTDFNVSNGETYAYYIVASTTTEDSPASATVVATYVGPVDQYKDVLKSADALTDRKGAVAVATQYGGIPQGCGEYQRLLKLRGQATMCGK